MNRLILLFFFIYNNLIKVISSKDITKFASLKFKTYYPLSLNQIYNRTYFEIDDYMDSYHFSKIYLEIETGNESNFKTNTNQTLNVIIDLKEKIFSTISHYFERSNKDNILKLCHFNTSKSTTFTEDQFYFDFGEVNIYSLSSYAKEYFKIYSDLELINNNITRLNLVNTIDHKDMQVCGNIGLIYTTITIKNNKYEQNNFIKQLYTNLNLPEISYYFNYSISSDEGIFIVGNMPHVYLPQKYSVDDLLPLYSSNPKEPKIFFDEMKIEGYNIKNADEQFQVLLTPDIEGFEFPEEYFNHIKTFFFDKYINESICQIESFRKIYEIIYCDNNNKFNISNFPKIYFNNVDKDFLVYFDGKDLFYFKDNKYFFKIIKNKDKDFFTFGRLFFQKYIAIFNFDKKQIYFYKNNIKGKDKNDINVNNEDNKSNVYLILMIIAIIVAIILFPLGLYLGKKLFEKRNKKAYELNDDDYQYKSSINDGKKFISPDN